MKKSRWKVPQRILVIDVGGSHVKFRIGPRGKIDRFDSGTELTAAQMAKQVTAAVPRDSYDAVSIGYPGLVFHGRITVEPHNLGRGWVRYDFQKAFGKPVRVINDAAMQAIGSYEGQRMLFLGLGTGMGSTLILDGVVAPMEMGHMGFRKDHTFEYYVGERGRLRMGGKKWSKVVAEVVEQLGTLLQVDYVVLGGGNARRLKKLPPLARLGNNQNAFIGGLRIWKSHHSPLLLGD
jgi:predicted NBD/HSP70 family sugar kinase